jgi:hypothetical protein
MDPKRSLFSGLEEPSSKFQASEDFDENIDELNDDTFGDSAEPIRRL